MESYLVIGACFAAFSLGKAFGAGRRLEAEDAIVALLWLSFWPPVLVMRGLVMQVLNSGDSAE